MGLFQTRRGHLRLRMLAAMAVLVSSTAFTAPAAASNPVLPPLPVPQPADALAQARKTGRAVDVTAATTPTDTVAANPNGTFTLTRYAAPVRTRVGQVWKNLDATLKTNADGTVSPAVTSSSLVFSGGGSGPMVTMRSQGKKLPLTLPLTLPAPVLSGPSATYANVLQGVDLKVTATTLGGFTQVFIVRDAAAAANPALRTLTLSTAGGDVTVTADAAGNLKASDSKGRGYFTAPAPLMWDSSAPANVAPAGVAGPVLAADGAAPGARVSPVAVSVTASGITLTPDTAMLTGAATAFPVYIDPQWTPQQPTNGPGRVGYASVTSTYPTTNYWNNTADSNKDRLQLGWNNEPWRARTMINFGIDAGILGGAAISKATLYARSVYSGSCTARKTRVFAPAATLTSTNANWDYWNSANLEAEITSQTFAGGYNSSCPDGNNLAFDVKPGVTNALANQRSVQTFVFAGDTNEVGDTASYKEFSLATIYMQIEYNHAPNTPVNLTTSPATGCTGTVDTVGDASVTLYAPVSDPDGGMLGARFEAWKTSDSELDLMAWTDPATTPYTSGSPAVLILSQAALEGESANAVTEFSWRIRIWDGIAYSGWSPICKFNFDPSRPGKPTATLIDSETFIGSPASIAVTKPSTGGVPAKYLYQLNAGPTATVAADGTGNATITITPTRRTNTVTITALSAGGNAGLDSEVITFTTKRPATAPANSDLNGDGSADLITTGNSNGLPSGVWYAPGKNNGQVSANTANIGIYGNGWAGDMAPANFNGARIIPGQFSSSGLQDVLAYYPAPGGGGQQGSGAIISGSGDGSPLLAQHIGNSLQIDADTLRDVDGDGFPIDSSWPIQLTNAGAAYEAAPDDLDDLIGVSGTAGNYHLTYYHYRSEGNIQGPYSLATPPPAAGTTWDKWQITATRIPSSGKTSMFLWNRDSGQLVLWKDLLFNINMQNGDITFAYASSHTLAAADWNKNQTLTLHAADADRDGDADLWAVGTGQTVSSYLTNGSTIGAPMTQNLSTATHTWALADMPGNANPGDTIASSADNTPSGTTALPLAGTTGAKWKKGDAFSPDAVLDGTTGTLATTGPAITTNASFSVSVWVKPTAASGTVISQDGSSIAGFSVYADPMNKSWKFAMPQTNNSNPVWDIASTAANTVQIGVWTQLTATWKPSGGVMRLYVNGVDAAIGTHTTTWNATGSFRAGAKKIPAGAIGDYLAGQISMIQTWNQVVDPAQALTAASFYQRITPTRFLDTRNGTGGTSGPRPAGNTFALKIAGINGIPASNVTAVAINLTVAFPTAEGYISAWPDLTAQPTTSNINFPAGPVNAGYAIVPVGTNGYINIHTAGGGGTVHLLGDVSGYFTSDSAAPGVSSYTPVNPVRFGNTFTGAGGHSGKIPTNGTWNYQVTGTSGVPAGATAVVANITAVNAAAPGFFIAWQQGQAQPSVSGLQYQTNAPSAGLVIIPLSSGGQFSLFSAHQADVLIDVMGYFTTGTSGQKYHAIGATRLLDTREDSSAFGPDTTRYVAPGNTINASNPTLIVNLAAVIPTAPGYLLTYPGDLTTTPPTSTLNFATSQTVANLAFVNTGSGSTIAVRNSSPGYTNIIADCTGYFSNN